MDEKGNSVALSVLIDHLNGWTIFVPFSIINIRGRIFAQMSNRALETREEAKRRKKPPARPRSTSCANGLNVPQIKGNRFDIWNIYTLLVYIGYKHDCASIVLFK
jgi:hypothetical protein